jgi:hypothetical protein
MSQYALCLAVKTVLQDALQVDDSVCDIGYDGEPNPDSGEEFIRVWQGDWSGIDCEGLAETMGCSITVTHRSNYAPKDRPGNPWQLLEARTRQVIAAIHLDKNADAVLNAANAIIGADANGFTTPLRFSYGARIEVKGPEWWNAVGSKNSQGADSGIAQTITFGGAERYQTIESMS